MTNWMTKTSAERPQSESPGEEKSNLPSQDFPHTPPLSLEDIARVHETSVEAVCRIAASLNLSPEGPFEMKDFVRLNRMLMTVRERYERGLSNKS